MTISKAYLILGMALVAGLTVAGVAADSSEPVATVVSGGGHEGHEGHDHAAHEGGEKPKMATYTFKGVITAIDAAKSTITIKHEKIGDYMEAMTMSFDVADASMLEGLKVGDEKAFILHVNPSMNAIVGVGEPGMADQAAAHGGNPHGSTEGEAAHACDHKEGEKCDHAAGEGCEHQGGEAADGDACCSKHGADRK